MMREVRMQLMRSVSSTGLVMILSFLCVKGDHWGLEPTVGDGRMHMYSFR